MAFIYSPDCNEQRLLSVIKDVVTVRIVLRYLTGDIMKHVKNVFLVLAFALSAAAFSTSVMAASNSKTPPGNTKSTPGGDLDISKIQTHSLTAPNGAITGQKMNLNLHIFTKFVVLIDCIFGYDDCHFFLSETSFKAIV
ncbi:hypothetical protein EYS49_23090 [Salmonella enterica]|nr:hypothetical protein [Salmonella enterica]